MLITHGSHITHSEVQPPVSLLAVHDTTIAYPIVIQNDYNHKKIQGVVSYESGPRVYPCILAISAEGSKSCA
jgi:hypothetical protein